MTTPAPSLAPPAAEHPFEPGDDPRTGACACGLPAGNWRHQDQDGRAA